MTPGMGDVMMALNCAHHWAEETNSKLQLNLHWYHVKITYIIVKKKKLL
jgi:hypothetical protein